MNLVDPWTQAFLVTPPVFCGRRLHPFSVSHSYLLKILGSPYICGGVTTKNDLLVAVDICSRTWEQNIDWITAGTGLKRSVWFAWKWRNINFDIADSSFSVYLDDYTRTPGHKADGKPSDGKYEVAAPLEWHLVYGMMNGCHFSESVAWNMPFNRAKCYYDVMAEANGDSSLESLYDMNIEEAADRMNKAAASGDIEAQRKAEQDIQNLVDAYRKARQ